MLGIVWRTRTFRARLVARYAQRGTPSLAPGPVPRLGSKAADRSELDEKN